MKHALVVAVAVVYFVVSLAEGGYPPEAVAAGTLLIWWAVIVGLAVGAWPRAGVPRPAILAGLCISGLALLTGLSVGWASDDGGAFLEVVRVAGYAGLFALVILTSPRESARSWLVGLAIGIAALAALSLGSRLEPALPGGDQGIGAFIPSARGRLSYPIGYWNGLAACMAVGSVILVWLGAQAETRLGRAMAIAALPPIALTIYLSASRGGIAAAGVGLAALILLGPARVRLLGGLAIAGAGGLALIALAGERPALVNESQHPTIEAAGDEILLATLLLAAVAGLARYLADATLERLKVGRSVARSSVAVGAVLAVAAVAAADPPSRWEAFKAEPAADRFGSSIVAERLASGSGSGRYQFWTTALDAFGQDPVTGIGAGGFEAWWNQHGQLVRVVRNAHSLFFETIAELGLPGLMLIVAFLALGFVYGWRRRVGMPAGVVEVTLACLAAGVFAAAIEWTWEIPAAFGPVVVAVALLTGPATLRRMGEGVAADDGDRAAAPMHRSFGWGVATLLGGWVAVWIAGVLFLTEVKLDDSRAAVDRGDLPSAAQDATDASTLQPWAAEPHLQLALVEERAGSLPAARREIAEAIDRAPEDWTLWYIASRIEEDAGDTEAAANAYERARALNPRSPVFTRPDAG